MRRLALLGVLAAVLLAPSGNAAPSKRVNAGSGITVALPAGWRIVHQRVAGCTDPVQSFVATTAPGRLHTGYRVPQRAGLVLLMEANRVPGRFPARPARFHLPQYLDTLESGCCEIPSGPGAELVFRDHGRRFYGFVYVGGRSGAREGALTLLNSLRISANPQGNR